MTSVITWAIAIVNPILALALITLNALSWHDHGKHRAHRG